MRLGFLCLRSVSLLFVWVVALMLAQGCAQRRFAQDRRPPSTSSRGVSSPVVYRTEVGIGSCLADTHQIKPTVAIPAAVVASLISAGVGFIALSLCASQPRWPRCDRTGAWALLPHPYGNSGISLAFEFS